MFCPNCAQPMNLATADNQTILHCSNCGGSFFEENGINRITVATAQILAEDKKTDEVSSSEKKCPKDQQILKPILTNLNQSQLISSPLPSDITLLRCGKCAGIFAYPDDLVKFKQAQAAKIEYFKLWSIPLPSLKTVIILSATALFFMTVLTNYTFFQKGLAPASARDPIKKVYLSRSGHYLFIYFKTETPFVSKIIFEDKTEKNVIVKIISGEPKTIHQLVTGDLNLGNEIYYQIVLTDERGKETKTEKKKMVLGY